MLRSVNVGPYDPSLGNRYEYQSTGVLNQNQLMFNFNTRFSPKLTLFSFYVLSKAMSDTDGVNTFPFGSIELPNRVRPRIERH